MLRPSARVKRPLLLFLLIFSLSAEAQAETVVTAEYYGEMGCGHCDDFEEVSLPAAEKASGIIVDLKTYDILSPCGFEVCERRLADLGHDFTIFPVLIIGNNAYQGNRAIEENLLPELQYFGEHGEYRPKIDFQLRSEKPGGVDLSFVPVFLAGLIDGINPCAFTTLLFFISFVSMRGKTKKETALFGLLFAAGIFITYFLIGLGLFNILRVSMNFSQFRLGLKVFVSTLTAVFCLLTLRDALLIRRGRTSEMSLVLPKSVKRRIHASIRKGAGSAAFGAGVFLTGLVVAVLELACTGQIYFPTIAFMIQTDLTWLGLGSLFLYNIAFILPLLAVLCIVLFGIRHERVTAFFKDRLGNTKIAMALIFAALTVLIWMF